MLDNPSAYRQYKEQLLNSLYLVRTNIHDKDIQQRIEINKHNLEKMSIDLTKLCLSLIDNGII